MISAERYEELNAIATEIFEALACERYEPSERGAGWAPTDIGYENVIAILARAKAKMWSDSPAEKRAIAIANAEAKAKRVAARLMGDKSNIGSCIHCGQWVWFKDSWRTSAGNDTCNVRKDRLDRNWNHEIVKQK
jgi:hypothetical protein